MIHFMSKEARAKVLCHESFVANDENLPIQINFEVQNSIEKRIPKKQQIHEIEEIVENNEFVTSSPNINSELENPNENVVAQKRDKDLQPIIQVRKLTKAEIVVFT